MNSEFIICCIENAIRRALMRMGCGLLVFGILLAAVVFLCGGFSQK